METRLLGILVCPVCKGSLKHDRQQNELTCRRDRLAFPIRDGVPIMLEDEAREFDPDARQSATVQPAADSNP